MRSLERANSDLVNAGRRKDEAARNEAVAYKKMQQAHDEEHSLSLEENKIMEQVNVSTAQRSLYNNYRLAIEARRFPKCQEHPT